MKKKKFNYSYILIILFGLIVSCAVYLVLNLDKVEVLVSTRNIEPMEVLTEDMLTTRYIDKHYLSEGTVSYEDLSHVLGKTIKYGIPQGNTVSITHFYNDEEYEQLRLNEADLLLYMLPVKAADALGGQIQSGDRINITFGYKSSAKPEEGLDTSKKVITILQYIEVEDVVITDDELSGLILKLTQEQYNKLTFALEYASNIYLTKLADNYIQIDNIEENEETFLNGKKRNESGLVINIPTKDKEENQYEEKPAVPPTASASDTNENEKEGEE